MKRIIYLIVMVFLSACSHNSFEKSGRMKIEASILSCDLLNLESEIKALTNVGIDGLHIDVMDGHFVPNIAFGIGTIKQISRISNLPITVHLMVDNPLQFIDVIPQNVSCIVIHSEGISDVSKILEKIKSRGIRAGLAINPSTKIDDVRKYLQMTDMALVMSVRPGFGGQVFIPSSLEKIRQIKLIFKDRITIEVDGGINNKTATIASKAGADILVAGSYLFNSSSENKSRTLKEKLKILCCGA